MKKALSVLVVFALALAAGCGRGKADVGGVASPAPPAKFSANIKIVYGDSIMSARLDRRSEKEFVVKMLEPEILTPLEISYSDGSCFVTYDDLKFETDLSRFPQTAFGALLVQALEDAEDGTDVEKTRSDGIWTYRGTGDGGVFVLTQNGETGEWLELEIEGAPLRVVFSDFKTPDDF